MPTPNNARWIIADVLAGFMPEGDSGQEGSVNLARAERILSVLDSGGYLKEANMDRIRRGRRYARLLVARSHARMVRRHRQERGRLIIGRGRPGEDPTLQIGWPHDALEVAEALLESVPRQHGEEFWKSAAAGPLAGLLYAASPCGNGKGIVWAGLNIHGPGWTEAAEICRRDGVPLLADGMLRIAEMDPRQRDSIRYVIRRAFSRWLLADCG